jgi:hypothetical protein
VFVVAELALVLAQAALAGIAWLLADQASS